MFAFAFDEDSAAYVDAYVEGFRQRLEALPEGFCPHTPGAFPETELGTVLDMGIRMMGQDFLDHAATLGVMLWNDDTGPDTLVKAFEHMLILLSAFAYGWGRQSRDTDGLPDFTTLTDSDWAELADRARDWTE